MLNAHPIRGVLAAIAATFVWSGAQAASEVDVGGYLDQVLATTQHDLLGSASVGAAPALGGGFEIRTEDGPSSAFTAFTPRLGGLGLAVGGRRQPRPGDAGSGEPRRLQFGLRDSAEIAGWQVDLAATADMQPAAGGTLDDGSSTLMVGGELAVSGLRLDAAVGRDATLLGYDGSRVTAGVGYDFGRLGTHMSYSLVERDDRAVATSLLTLGSQFAVSSGLILKGDLSFAEEENGDASTAGLVSLRLNF